MEKYLFTDGTNVIREVESREELQSLIQSSAGSPRARIWIFSSNEWITVSDFNNRSSRQTASIVKKEPVVEPGEIRKPGRRSAFPGLLKKTLFGTVTAAAIFLVYNFTRVTWTKAAPLAIVADRPSNTPVVNVDSIIESIEISRGQKLDRTTRTNLRIRNTWPDLIQLQLAADRDTNKDDSRYHNPEVTIDNSTGYNIDNAVVKLSLWKDSEVINSDTIRFTNIGYASPAKRTMEGLYRGDSISVSFISIRAKAFNFCYSSDKKNNSPNYNDRWYCRE
jgi:hypothetical protein